MATAPPVNRSYPLDVRLFQLRHAVAPVLEVDAVLPESQAKPHEEGRSGGEKPCGQEAVPGEEEQCSPLLCRDEGDAAFIVDEVAIGVPQVVQQSGFADVSPCLEAVVCPPTPSMAVQPVRGEAHRIRDAEALGQCTCRHLNTGVDGSLKARPGVEVHSVARLTLRMDHIRNQGRQGQHSSGEQRGELHFRGMDNPKVYPLSKEPPVIWVKKVQSL